MKLRKSVHKEIASIRTLVKTLQQPDDSINLLLNVIAAAVVEMGSVIPLMLVGSIIDIAIAIRSAAILVRLGLVSILAFLVYSYLTYVLRPALHSVFVAAASARLSKKSLSCLLQRSGNQAPDLSIGELQYRIVTDTQKAAELIAQVTVEFVGVLVKGGVLVYIGIKTVPGLAILTILLSPVPLLLSQVSLSKRVATRRIIRSLLGTINNCFRECFLNLRVTKAHGSLRGLWEKALGLKQELLQHDQLDVRARSQIILVSEAWRQLMRAVIIFVLGRGVITNQLTVGNFAVLYPLLMQFEYVFARARSLYIGWATQKIHVHNIAEIISLIPGADSSAITVRHAKKNSISIQNVSYCTPHGCLENVSLECLAGRITLISGKSGIGKSTLIHMILGLRSPESGKIVVSINDDEAASRDRVGYAPQKPYILNRTIAENIAFGRDIPPDRVYWAAKIARVLDFAQQLADGLDTVLEEGGSNLSGGERQRISVARAIAGNPDILIIDEGLNNVEEKVALAIMDDIRTTLSDSVIILVSHGALAGCADVKIDLDQYYRAKGVCKHDSA